jgi:thioredoxin 1
MIEIIKFSKNNCRPCAVLSNYLSEINFEQHNATLSEINIADDPSVIEKYGLTSVPVLVYERNGVEVHRLNGLSNVEEIVEAIEFAKRAK